MTGDMVNKTTTAGSTAVGEAHASKEMVNQLLRRVDDIAPVLREHSAQAEQNRTLSRPVVDAMRDAQLFKMARPAAFGGLELDPVSIFRGRRGLPKRQRRRLEPEPLCGRRSPPRVVRRRRGQRDPQHARPHLAAALFPPGRAVAVEGGYQLTGRWGFVSGCQHAKWFLLVSLLMDGGESQLDGQGNPQQLLALVPAAETTILDTWHTLGMRGTGSHDVTVEDVFVPAHRAAAFAPLEQPSVAFAGPLYRLTVWTGIALLAPPALGIARAAIDDFIELARAKNPSFTGSALRDRQVVQRQVAEAEAHLGAGRAFLHTTFEDSWNAAVNGEPIDLPRKLRMQLATTHAVACAVKAVDLLHAAAGSSAIRNERGFQRYFRDVHTLSQNAHASSQRYESVGALMLGAKSDWGFFAF